MTSFATELAKPSVTDVRMYVRTDTLPRLIHKEDIGQVTEHCNFRK